MEVIKGLLLHRIHGNRRYSAIDLSQKNPVMVAPGSAPAETSGSNLALPLASLAANFAVRRLLKDRFSNECKLL
jgi:hypothetical protein